MKRAFGVCVGALLLSACLHQDSRGQRDRDAAGLFENTNRVKAPLKSRCEKYGQSSVRGPCDEAQFLAQKYVRDLSTGDAVCLEGGFGDPPAAACLARANVSDVANDKVLLDIKDAQPNSRWYNQVSSEIWFDDGALVDLYLGEHGF